MDIKIIYYHYGDNINMHSAKSFENIINFDKVKYLYCNFNSIYKLPNLPSNLNILYCAYNNLKQLPKLFNNIEIINCSNNKILYMPILPSNLLSINCKCNNLTKINKIPKKTIECLIYDNIIKFVSYIIYAKYIKILNNNNLFI